MTIAILPETAPFNAEQRGLAQWLSRRLARDQRRIGEPRPGVHRKPWRWPLDRRSGRRTGAGALARSLALAQRTAQTLRRGTNSLVA